MPGAGADRAVHLCDRAFAGSDTLATARALAAALRREAPDLILCGRNSVDAETGQVGPELAELLDLPQVTVARTLAVDPAALTLTAERETDAGLEVVTAPLPALVSAAEDLAPERFTTKAEREAAQAKPIATIGAAELDVDPAALGFDGSPTWVLGLEVVEEHRRREVIDAETPAAAAAALVERLMAHGLFGEWLVERHVPPVAAIAARAPRPNGCDVLVVAETTREALQCGGLPPLWGGRGEVGETVSGILTHPPAHPKAASSRRTPAAAAAALHSAACHIRAAREGAEAGVAAWRIGLGPDCWR
jgi:electron transfer flavoprotein alpha/beta subunit